MPRDFVTDVNQNLRSYGVRLANELSDGETRQFGPITAASAGVPASVYNRIYVFDPPPRDDLTAAVAWMEERVNQFFVTVAASVVDMAEALADDLGLERNAELNWMNGESQPGMALASLDNLPPGSSGVAISQVSDSDGFENFVTVFASVFDAPEDEAGQIYRPSVTADEAGLFVGRIDDQPVACGQLQRSGDVAGVYIIGVDHPFRRQGIGKAMTSTVVRAGRRAGCKVGVLQPSEMAYSLYERMGFETVVSYHHFEPVG